MTVYCLGFIFSPDLSQVVLLKKDRGTLVNCLNGIGGKCGNSEYPSEAMVRECFEETNIKTCFEDWSYVGEIKSNPKDEWLINIYAKRSLYRPWDGKVNSLEEKIIVVNTKDVLFDERIYAPHTKALIVYSMEKLISSQRLISIQDF
jgi:8-oxo-dGTP pyrophosphatase MutT (NUDIX family)